MKTGIIFCIILFPILGYGQMIDKTNKWNDLQVMIPTCKSSNCEGKSYITHSYSITHDTIINDISYSVIIDTFYLQQGPTQVSYTDTAGYIRQSDNKVYYYSKSSNEEFLLYDFGLTMGEDYSIRSLTFAVINIDSVELEENKHLRLSLANQSDTIEWIEDIGAIQGFLYPDYYYFESKLLCFEKNKILEFKNELGLDCIVTLITSLNETEKSSLIVYPNPTKSAITIEYSEIITEITVMDLFGKLLYSFQPNQSEYLISLSQLEGGIYFIRVNNEIFKVIKF